MKRIRIEMAVFTFFLVLVAFAGYTFTGKVESKVFAQGGNPGGVTLSAPTPPPVQQVFSSTSGTTGLTYYCYWVVAVYNIGMSSPLANTCINTANATLSGSNYNIITWNPPPGATPTGYWVARNTSNSFPGTGTFAVNSSVLSNTTFSQNDESNTLNSFTFSPASNANYLIAVDNIDYGVPAIGFYTQQGILQWQRYMFGNVHHDIVSVEGNITPANIHAVTTIVTGIAGVNLRVEGVLFQAIGGAAATCTSVSLKDTTGVVAVTIPVADLTQNTVNLESAANLTLTTFLTNLTLGAGLELADTGGPCTGMTSMNYRFYYKILP